jgi:hypothetical protein
MQAMENKKDIGKAFREKLDLLDKVPGDHLWNAIEADLEKKKKRRVLPFWFILTDVATMALLLFFIGSDLVGEQRSDDDMPTRIEGGSIGKGNNEKDENADSSGNIDAITSEAKDAVIDGEPLNHKQDPQDPERNGNHLNSSGGNYKGTKSDLSNSTKNNSKVKKAKSGVSNVSKKRGSGNAAFKNNKATESTISDENQAKLSGNSTGSGIQKTSQSGMEAEETTNAVIEKDTVIKTITKKERQKKQSTDTTKTVQIDEEKYKTFSVFLYARPTYFGVFDKTSSLDKSLDSLPIKSEIVFNYGGYLSFQYDEKWTVRAGIAKTVLRYTTQNIIINNGFEAPAAPPDFYGVDYASGVSNLGIAEQNENSTSMDIEQELSYFEVPIELKYSFYKKAITIDGIGGVSTLFLTNNTVTAKPNNGREVHMGMTRDIFKAHINANIGVGFNYKFLKNFQLNIEPMFKYHFRTGEVKQSPFSFVVQAGIEYMFNSRKKTKTEKK